jgi:glutamate mutase epsilon subunit
MGRQLVAALDARVHVRHAAPAERLLTGVREALELFLCQVSFAFSHNFLSI